MHMKILSPEYRPFKLWDVTDKMYAHSPCAAPKLTQPRWKGRTENCQYMGTRSPQVRFMTDIFHHAHQSLIVIVTDSTVPNSTHMTKWIHYFWVNGWQLPPKLKYIKCAAHIDNDRNMLQNVCSVRQKEKTLHLTINYIPIMPSEFCIHLLQIVDYKIAAHPMYVHTISVILWSPVVLNWSIISISFGTTKLKNIY